MNVAARSDSDRKALSLAMNLSLGFGLLMFVMKMGAYLLTGSAAILSDAAESVVHVAAVIFAAYSLRLSYRPADADHLYGHAKISFFSAGFEGAMIMLAALYIIYQSIHKWLGGLQLENLGAGTALTAAAAAINGGLGAYLVWLGRRKNSLILEANGKHVLTDCWTSIAVLIGLGLVLTTGWLPFDPICGILMAGNILRSGAGLVKSAFSGLMDTADPAAQARLTEVLERETRKHGLSYHQLRHRNLGDAHWVEVHLLFPGDVSLTSAHRTATEIENVIEQSLEPRAYVTTHLESDSDHAVLHPHEDMKRAGTKA
ncbi:MAG: cation diffusion facilitator family transporter [Verrucomicrobia bacterium]|jgi:cation diffusion facilitator family transporter|nr:cation diffusion facilitator family transporter [Verrucomicrobiota bacterium]